jgi:hypothetical protein
MDEEDIYGDGVNIAGRLALRSELIRSEDFNPNRRRLPPSGGFVFELDLHRTAA